MKAGKELLDGMFEDIGESPEFHQLDALFPFQHLLSMKRFNLRMRFAC